MILMDPDYSELFKERLFRVISVLSAKIGQCAPRSEGVQEGFFPWPAPDLLSLSEVLYVDYQAVLSSCTLVLGTNNALSLCRRQKRETAW